MPHPTSCWLRAGIFPESYRCWRGRVADSRSVAARKDVTLWKRFMPPLPRLLGGLFAGLLMVHLSIPNQVVSSNELICSSVLDLQSEPVHKGQGAFCKLLSPRRDSFAEASQWNSQGHLPAASRGLRDRPPVQSNALERCHSLQESTGRSVDKQGNRRARSAHSTTLSPGRLSGSQGVTSS